jgi:DHA1 family bicyclomycin/chloramphenicol resistance-like MFS transporter
MEQRFKKIMIFATVMVMDILTGMEFDLFVPSFPELQNHFALSPSWVEALLSANFIGYCLSLIFLGDLSDRYGRKPIILLGLVVFVIGSLICLWPPSYEFLLLGRFLQGLGIAAPAILSFVIIADAYPLKEQQYLMAMLNGSLNIAVGLAPVIGSYVTLLFHWQGNFAVLLLLGILVLLMTIVFIPSHEPQHNEALSLRGLKGYLTLFRSRPLVLLITNILFIFVPYWIFVGMSPLLYMKDLGVSLAHFGYYQGILALVFAFGCILYGLIIKNIVYDQKKMLNLAMQILIASFVILTIITLLDIRNALIITLCFLSFIIGQIIPSVILYPLCLNLIPQAKGRVSAIIQGGRLILTSIALQIAGYFYVGSFQNIGLIIIGFILVGIVTLYLVITNRELMEWN